MSLILLVILYLFDFIGVLNFSAWRLADNSTAWPGDVIGG